MYEAQPCRVMPHFTPLTITSLQATPEFGRQGDAAQRRGDKEVVAFKQPLDRMIQPRAAHLCLTVLHQAELAAAIAKVRSVYAIRSPHSATIRFGLLGISDRSQDRVYSEVKLS